MRKYRNILVIVEPQAEKQTAIKRVMEIAKFSPDSKITALLSIYDFSSDITSILNIDEQSKMRADILKKNEEWLKTKIAEQHLDGSNISGKVVWQRNITDAIVKELAESNYDLVIKSADSHGFLDTMFFTPTDWQLLRKSEIPVLITKDHEWPQGSSILVAVNFNDNDNQDMRLMNIRLLRNAQELAHLIGGEIHLVNAAPPIVPTAIVEIPGFTPDIYSEAVTKQNREQMKIFASKHSIPEERCHILEGQPDDVIPEVARKLNACAVLIGHMGRTGISAALVGNICEEIVDEVNCDLLVIKKKDTL